MANNIVKFGGSQIISMAPGSSEITKTLPCGGKVSAQNISVTSASDPNLVSENIRRGKSIFGVTGNNSVLRMFTQSGENVSVSGTVEIKRTSSSSSGTSVRYIDVTGHGVSPVYWSAYEWHTSISCYGAMRIEGTLYDSSNTDYTGLDNLLFNDSHCYIAGVGSSDVWTYTADIFGY